MCGPAAGQSTSCSSSLPSEDVFVFPLDRAGSHISCSLLGEEADGRLLELPAEMEESEAVCVFTSAGLWEIFCLLIYLLAV